MTVIPVRTFAEAVRQVLDLRREDWGEAPEVFEFYGRQTELQTMQDWMLTDTCRLLVLLGMGGIGKTTLAVKLAKQTVTRGDHTPKPFRHLFWRDLRNAPLCEDILGDCIKFLSEQRELNLPQQTHERISLLLSYLRKHRCLLVFDNIEAIFQGKGGRVGYYREGYENYGELFRRIGAESHISCLLLTSREKPKEIALLEGASVSVRTLQLGGLEQQAGRVLLQEKRLDGTEEQWNTLIDSYGGHPLALQQVAALIQEQFDRHIATFITEFLPQGIPLIDAVQAILEEHYERLSERERQIMYWLAVERGPVSLPELRKDMAAFPLLPRKLPEIMEALTRRALIVKTDEGFTLPPVVMEYLTERFITHIHEDLCFERLSLFNSHALIKAQAKDYIRESQVRLILKPLVEQVLFELNQQGLESQLQDLLARLRANHPRKPGYAGGNTLNLLLHLNDRLNHWDFSNLSVWQAYLQNVDLHDVNFTYSDFSGSMFTETFGGVVSVAFNHDGTLLAAGMTSNEIRFWQTTDYTHLRTCEGHRGWVWSVAFSPDGKTLASGSLDHTVRVWDVATGTCLRTFEGHTGWIWSVAFSPDGHLLASACGDSTVRIWDLRTGNPLTTLQKHTGGVYTVAFSPDGKRLVSGGGDKTVLLWRTEADKILNADTVHHLGEPDTLHTHHNLVRSVAFGPDGHLLVSGSDDKTVCVLHIETGQCLETLGEYTGLVKSVALSADGHILASGSDDATVRLWDLYSKRYLHTLQGHSNWVNHIAFHPDGKMLASGSSDQTVKLWDVRSGYCLKTLQGYSNRVLSVTFSPDSSILAASFSDQTVRLWDVPSGACFKTLRGHTNWVMKGVFSPDGTLLASTSSDTTSRIWDVAAKTCLRVLRGHTQQVRAVAFSPDGKTLITGSDDNTIRLWNLATGETLQVFEERDWILSLSFHSDGSLFASGSQDHTIRVWDAHSGNCLKILEGHALPIWSVRFLPNSDLLVSGSEDQSVRVWDMNTEECLNVLKGHTSRIRSVASSSDGSLLASGSEDTSIRLWDRATGECLRVLSGHSNWVRSVVFSPDDNALASGSEDGTIRLWEIKTGMCQATLQPYRPYERMNITGVTGLTDTQKTTLKELGAIENE